MEELEDKGSKGRHHLVHVITGLQTGGAEMMLYKLLRVPQEGALVTVVSLRVGGSLAQRIISLGVPVFSLFGGSALEIPGRLWRLIGWLRSNRPDLIQGWMYHGNLAATVLGFFVARRKTPVLWNIRHSLYSYRLEKPMTRIFIRIGAYLSHTPKAIIYNSEISASQHEREGYAASKRIIIGNGFDLKIFKPDIRARISLSQIIQGAEFVIGSVARYHPIKDHACLLQATNLLVTRGLDIKVVLVGKGMDSKNESLRTIIQKLEIANHVIMLGERVDLPAIMAGFDILALTSISEAFPNVIGEAMACEIPCVATDVGDSRIIIGETGLIVPPRNPEALAEAILKLWNAGENNRRILGRLGRQRIESLYSMEHVQRQYAESYKRFLH